MVVVLQFSLSFVSSSKPLLFARAWDFPFTAEATDMPTGKSRDLLELSKLTGSFLRKLPHTLREKAQRL
jgi:hypothetical protein